MRLRAKSCCCRSAVPGGRSTIRYSSSPQATSSISWRATRSTSCAGIVSAWCSASRNPTDITFNPRRSTGSSVIRPKRESRPSSQERSSRVRLMPSINGMSGPYTSASSRPTLRPLSARARARLRLMVDFPTPPFPLATATTFTSSHRADGETVDDVVQNGRLRVDLGEPLAGALRSLLRVAPRALRTVLAHVAVLVEDVVHDLEQQAELLRERAPGRLLRLRQLRRPQR